MMGGNAALPKVLWDFFFRCQVSALKLLDGRQEIQIQIFI